MTSSLRVAIVGCGYWGPKLVRNVAGGEALVRLARGRQRQLLVDHTFGHTPALRKIRELIAARERGNVPYLDSVRINLGLFPTRCPH
jgi:hypothetical protein